VVCLKKPGDPVEEGEPVLELHTDDPRRLAAALAALGGGIKIGGEPRAQGPLVIERIGP
jgi:thymidine phosphorylase